MQKANSSVLKAMLVTLGLGLCSNAFAQMPQPIRDPGFGSSIQPQPGVYPAQAYQRVGKQVYSHPRRKSSTSSEPALPWLQRLIQPRGEEESQPTVDYSKHSVAGTQPPLSNANANGNRNSAGNRGSVANQFRQGEGSHLAPITRVPRTQIQQPSPIESDVGSLKSNLNWDGRKLGASNPSSAGTYGTSSSNLDAGSNRKPRLEARSQVSAVDPGQLTELQPTEISQRLSSQPTATQGMTQQEFLSRVEEQLPPKVSRIPLPGAVKESISDQKETKSEAATVTSNETNESLDVNDRVAKSAAVPAAQSLESESTEATAPENVSGQSKPDAVPAQLVGVPTAESVAEKNEQSKIGAQYLTTQLRRPVQETNRESAEQQPEEKALAGAESSVRNEGEEQGDASEIAMPTLEGSRETAGKLALPNPDASTAHPATPALPTEQQTQVEVQLPELSLPAIATDKSLQNQRSASEVSASPSAASDEGQKPELPALPRDANPAGSSSPAQMANSGKETSGAWQPAQSLPSATPPTASVSVPTKALPAASAVPNQLRPSDVPQAQDSTQEAAVAKVEASFGQPSVSSGGKQENSRSAVPNREVALQKLVPQAPKYQPAASERMRMQSPGLSVVLNGPSTMPLGMPVDYEIVATNRDSVDLNGLILRIEVPAGVVVQPASQGTQYDLEKAPDGATLMTWGVSKLSAGAEEKAKVRLLAQKANDFSLSLDWTLIPLTQAAQVHVIAPSLKMTIEGPEDVVYAQSNRYRLHLKNEGKAAAHNVKVALAAGSLGGTQTDVGTVAPGQQETVEFELGFEETGSVKIEAYASAANNARVPATKSVMVRRSRLVAALEAPSLVYHGNAIAYRVILKNEGDASSDRTQATLKLPVEAKPSGLPYSAKYDNGKLTWPIDPIQPGGSKEYHFQVGLNLEGEHRIAFECLGDVGQSITAEARTAVQSIADLKLLVSDPIAPAPIGAEVVYELQLTNRGSKAANNVRVLAQFSKGIEPTRAVGHGYRVVPGQVFFEPIASVGPGETVKLMVYAAAENVGMHRFRAEVRTDDEANRLVQEEATQYMKSNSRLATPPSKSSLR